jgi:tRNA(Ile)-lysidine synthase
VLTQPSALGDAEFAALMDRLGPFERAPSLAVAVSGGADSVCLCLLADRWARGQGGRAVGLTVDHGLRPAAADEAVQTGQWLAAHGIEHHILCWQGDKPETGIQAAARFARYALLRDWCAGAGILHLLLAHHRDDQAETLLLRLGRGSGVDGLSSMSPIVELPALRLLRPLLTVPHARLVASLQAEDQPWIEDPSNTSAAYGRVRLRQMAPLLAAEGMDASRLAGTARRLGRARQALERATAEAMVQAVALFPAGYAVFDAAQMDRLPIDVSLRLVARLCQTIGGSPYPPRLERLERLHDELRAGLAVRRSFAGCVLAPTRSGVVVCREPAAIAGPLAVGAGQTVLWDRRFTLTLGGSGQAVIRALGADGWKTIRAMVGKTDVSSAVRLGLPSVFDQHGVSAVPHLGYKRNPHGDVLVDHLAFTPANPLAGVGHCLV